MAAVSPAGPEPKTMTSRMVTIHAKTRGGGALFRPRPRPLSEVPRHRHGTCYMTITLSRYLTTYAPLSTLRLGGGRVRSRRDDLPVYVISVAADLLGLHPRTLRIYEEKGLVQPARRNHQRLYSERDLERGRMIRHLTREMGVNLAGVRVLIEIHERMEVRGSKDVVSWVVERTVRRRRVP